MGNYVVDGWLRDGGMAAIYRARRVSDDVRVALKLQLPSTAHLPEICARFDREAEAMHRVKGEPNIVTLHDAGIFEDERRYFLMEWVEGEDLEELLDFHRNQDQRLSIPDVCRLGHEIAAGLAALHGHGLIHCDLKPANVMVGDDQNGAAVVKLVDFGIVADLTAGAEAHEHAEESVMGTSAYMAPEQAAGAPPEPPLDLFALGVVLYEALTGSCVPPDGWSPETLPSIGSLRRGVPHDFTELVRACMSVEPRQRPASARAVRDSLASILMQIEPEAFERSPASSEEVPVRTGGTIVTPRTEIDVLGGGPSDPIPVRTGGTEVARTYEEVLSASGVAPAQPSAPQLGSVVARGGQTEVMVVPPAEPEVVRPSSEIEEAVAPAEPAVVAPTVEPERVARVRAETAVASRARPQRVVALTPTEDAAATLGGTPSEAGASPKTEEARWSKPELVASPIVEESPGPHAEPEGARDSRSKREVDPLPSEAAPVAKPEVVAVAAKPSPLQSHVDDYEDDIDTGGRGRWLIVAILVPALLGGGWLWWRSTERAEDEPMAAKRAPVVIVSRTPDGGSPADPGDASNGQGAGGPSLDGATDAGRPSETPADEDAPAANVKSEPRNRPRSKSKGPDKAACEAMRARAAGAKEGRNWKGLLKATAKRACWPGSERLERRRLRVEAYAELGEFSRCVREGGKNPDKSIRARVGYCKKKLGAG